MRILVFFLAVLFLGLFPSTASAASVLIPQLTSVLFNGGVSPETTQALDLTGANWTSVALTNNSGTIYTALVDVTISTGGTQVTRHSTIKFKLQSTTQPPTNNTSYKINVLVLKYFPLTADGQNIDINVTGDVGDSYQTVRQKTVSVTNNLKAALERATKYLGYKDPNTSPSLLYNIVDTKEYTQAVPVKPKPESPRYPDYNGIMTAHNICDWVDNKGVREVWLWAYQGPNKQDGQPFLGISESKMSGPYGDISNSPRYHDMPVCQNTYRVYTFNYGRGTYEALESWSHQIEAEMKAVGNDLFRVKFQGPYHPQATNETGRCGSAHNPPNARFEYDRNNPTPQKSDCLDWNPDGVGSLSDISCSHWGCAEVDDNNNSSLNYMVWNWQNLPGAGNTKTYQGKRFRNWWDVHGDFDNVMKNPNLFMENLGSVTPAPTPYPALPGVFEKGLEAGEQHDASKVELVAESGAKWVRLNFVGSNWAAGSVDVNTYNTIINAYSLRGIKIIGLIGAQSVSGGYNRNNPSAFTREFTDAADAIVSRFGDRVKVYELFNEPNDWAGGNSSQVPERYFAQYLASIYRKVKVEGGRADIFLNSGPLFSFDQNNGVSYLQGTYTAGKSLIGASSWESIKSQTGSYPLDGVGYHIYVAQGMGDQGQVESKILGNLNAISTVINTNDPGKQIWITEIGWGTGAGRVSEEVQASNLEKAYGVVSNHPAVKLGMWFTLTDFDSSEWGLIRSNGTKKLAWSSFKRVTSQLPTPIPTATVTPTPSNRPTSIPTTTPTPSPRALSSPTPAPFNEQEYLSEPEPPEENPFFPPPISSQPEIRIILFGNQPLDPSGQSPLSIHLNGQPGQQSAVLLPVSLSYSQGPTKNLAIQFNYFATTGGTTTGRTTGTGGGSGGTVGSSLNQQKYDLNSDKIINIIDVEIFFNEWRNKLRGGTYFRGDYNSDGVINSIDYAMLKNQIGKRV